VQCGKLYSITDRGGMPPATTDSGIKLAAKDSDRPGMDILIYGINNRKGE